MYRQLPGTFRPLNGHHLTTRRRCCARSFGSSQMKYYPLKAISQTLENLRFVPTGCIYVFRLITVINDAYYEPKKH
jgi:hypothetical protein